MKAWAALLPVCVVLGGCPEQKTSEPGPGLTKLTAQVEAFTRRLRALRDKTPAPSPELAEQPCPDETIEKATAGAPAALLIADYDYLERYVRPDFDPFAGPRAGFRLLTAPALQAVLPPAQLRDAKTATDVVLAIQKLDERYDWIAVLRTRERRLPRREGDKFHAGRLDGGLYVFELATGELVCRARVEAESSAEVAGLSGSSPEQTLHNDFLGNVRRAVGDAVRRISRVLREDLG